MFTLNPEPQTLKPKTRTLHPQPSTLNPPPQTPSPQPQTLSPKPQTLNPKHTTPGAAQKEVLGVGVFASAGGDGAARGLPSVERDPPPAQCGSGPQVLQPHL